MIPKSGYRFSDKIMLKQRARRHRFFQEIACFFQDARVRADDIQPEDVEGLRPINEVSKAKRRMP
jgi:hypothetical protein